MAMSEMDWRSNENRQKIRDQIEQNLKGINVIEVESHAFENSSSQKEYINLISSKIGELKKQNEKIVQSQRLAAQRAGLISGTSPSPAFMDGSSLHAPNGNQQSALHKQQMLQQQMQQAGLRTVVQQQADPINALQHLTKQGMQSIPGQQTGQVIRQSNQMTPVIQQRMQFQGYSGGPRNVTQQVRGDMIMMQGQPQRLQMMTQQGQIMQQGQFVSNAVPAQFHLSTQPRVQHISQIQTFNQVAGSPGNLQGSGSSQQPLVSQQHLQNMQPSPALAGSGMMIPSPSNLNIPSQSPAMQPHLIGLSPSSRMSLSSPGSHLGTPGNPGSVSVGSAQMSAIEEQEYLQKWEHLQKYLEPLKKMINKIDKEEDKKMDLNKMKNLLDILNDRNKRVTLGALIRCETVLEKQLQVTSDAITSCTNTSSTGAGDSLIFGQEVYDALVAHRKSPNLNHALIQTFGVVKDVIYFPQYEEPVVDIVEPLLDIGKKFEVEDSIQLEVAKLNRRFVVHVDESHFPGSDSVMLLCKLDDESLPAVPPLMVHLPKGYPLISPMVHMNEDVYGSSELFKKIYEGFKEGIDRIMTNYSLTTLLNLWEVVVRKSLE